MKSHLSRRFHAVLFVGACFFAWPSAWSAPQTPAVGGGVQDDFCLAMLELQVKENRFTTGRNLAHYVHLLGSGFGDDVLKLNAQSHWVDMGAGSTRAQQESVLLERILKRPESGLARFDPRWWRHPLRTELSQKPLRTPKLTAVAAQMPADARGAITKFERSYGADRFRVLEGRFIEEIPAAEIGSADLITDVFGPMKYTSDPSAVIRRYLEILKPGGRAHIILHIRRGEDGSIRSHAESFKIVAKGTDKEAALTTPSLALDPWFNSIKGARIEFTPNGFILTRTQDPIEVAPLRLLRLDVFDEGVPWRAFTLD